MNQSAPQRESQFLQLSESSVSEVLADAFSPFVPKGQSIFNVEVSAYVRWLWAVGGDLIAGEEKVLAPTRIQFALIDPATGRRKVYLAMEASADLDGTYADCLASLRPVIDLFGIFPQVGAVGAAEVFSSLRLFHEALSGLRDDPTGRKIAASLGRLRAVHQLEDRIVEATFFSTQDVVDLQFEQSHQCYLFIENPCTRDLYGRLREHHRRLVDAEKTKQGFDDYYREYLRSLAMTEAGVIPVRLRADSAKPMMFDISGWIFTESDPVKLAERLAEKYRVHDFHRQAVMDLVQHYLERKALGEEPRWDDTELGADTMELFL